MKSLGVALATVAGAGYFPFASGTVGSAIGVGLYLLMRHWPPSWQVGLVVGVILVGTWASAVAARHFDREDPSQVVVDEVAGQLVTLVFTGAGVGGAVLGFFLFRILDIVKPWPSNRLESLPGGAGVMADDVMAALYGNALMQIAMWVFPGAL